MDKFQQRLHNLRIENGYSLESLSNELNKRFDASFNKGMLSKYESGKTVPDFRNVPYLAEVFGVSVDYLIGVSDNPTRQNSNTQGENNTDIPVEISFHDPAEIEKAMKLYEQYKNSLPQIQDAVASLLKSRRSDS